MTAWRVTAWRVTAWTHDRMARDLITTCSLFERPHGRLGLGVHGCMVAWLPGRVVAWLHGCMASPSKQEQAQWYLFATAFDARLRNALHLDKHDQTQPCVFGSLEILSK
eukprot:351453-Chlamydomonas_euryale.AAC.3